MGILPIDFEVLSPSDDRIFKLLLTSPEAEPALMDLISATIGRPVVGVIIRNNELPVTDTEEKSERFDVNCKIDDGTQVDIEMQASHIEELSGDHKNLKDKSIYYLCDLHSSQPARGMKRYDELVQTYQITFCSYTVFPKRPNFLNPFSMRHDETNELLSDAIKVIYVELSKLGEILKKSVSDMTDLEKWSVFFKYAEDRRYRATVNKVIESKEELQMAGNLLMSISKDERERAIFRSRRMYQTDLESNLATAEERGKRAGRAEGRAEGRTEGKIEIARNMIKDGESVEKIMRYTGLTHDEVGSLRNTD